MTDYGAYATQHVGDYWTYIDIETAMIGLFFVGLPWAILMYGGVLVSMYQRHKLRKAIRRKRAA